MPPFWPAGFSGAFSGAGVGAGAGAGVAAAYCWRRGLAACGRLPFGRTFDPETGRWGIDPAKLALVEDCARRYLAGAPLLDLATEHGISFSTLHATLTDRSGDTWEQTFRSERLNINEVVQTKVPRLLPEETIQAIKRQAEANKTWRHGQQRTPYLLGRVVFCAACGYAMSGHVHSNRGRYYQHKPNSTLARLNMATCPRANVRVRADDLEDAVMRDLFDLFGNPAAVQRAVEAAVPNPGQIDELRQRRQRLAGELEKVRAALGRVVDAIADQLLSNEQARQKLDELNQREAILKVELGQIDAALEHLPTEGELRASAERFGVLFRERMAGGRVVRSASAKFWARRETINTDFDALAWEDARALVQLVFGGKTPDGKRMGVHVEWTGQKDGRRNVWSYRVNGILVDQWGRTPKPPWADKEPDSCDPDTFTPEFGGGPLQGRLMEEAARKGTTNSGLQG